MRLLFSLVVLWAATFFSATQLPAAQLPGEGADRAITGEGQQPGRFGGLLDLAFGADSRLYVLDLGAKDDKGNDYVRSPRIQVFDKQGVVQGAFAIDEGGDGTDLPTRIAIDSAGRIYVAYPASGRVQRYVDGKPERSFALPSAMAVAVGTVKGREAVVAIGSRHAVVDGKWAWLGGESMTLLDPASGMQTAVALPRRLFAVQDLTVSASGEILVLANDHEPEYDTAGLILGFAADGRLTRTLGLGGKTRVEDGSELKHSLTTDRAGRIYAMTWGNPGRVVRFDADGQHLTTRPGQFAWAIPWSMHSSYCALATDPDDRLWVASASRRGDQERDSHPALLRVRGDFFEEDGREVQSRPSTLLGFKPELRSDLPYDVGYEPGPIAMQVVFPAGRRTLDQAQATWRAFDAERHELAHGALSFALQDGAEAAAAFTFTAPRFGWYLVECEFTAGGKRLDAIAKGVGVTPRFPGLPVLAAGTAVGGWEDTTRSVFCGLPNVRLHPHKYQKNLDELVAVAERGKRDGAIVVVQFFEGKNQVDLALAKQVVTRLKGIVTYYELMNEPNFSMSPEELAALAKELVPAIRLIDPALKVMGPTVCGIDLGWNRRFFAAGGDRCIDIVAVHDYEGHESVSPEHWYWKFAELRKLMAEYGLQDAPIWQTERAISVIRGGLLTPLTQAARLTLQSDLLETLGVPREHNNHYYLNEGGFDSVPSYVWSGMGPFPAALASRTRQAMVGGRRYDARLDFGPGGNELYLGLRHVAPEGSTITLRNLGTTERPVAFAATGDTVEIVDAFGNARREPVKSGAVTLSLGQLPTYVRLAKGQVLTPPVIDYGRNIADTAVVSFAGEYTGELAWLTNGQIETFHGGNPLGGTGGERIWTGAPPTPAAPRILELRWPGPRSIHRVLVHGVEADNQFCALIDYDVEVETAPGAWMMVDQVRVPLPPTDAARTAKTLGTTWYVRSNRFAHEFAPIDASAVRLVIRRTTFGFAPDEPAMAMVKAAWGGTPQAKTMLREIAVFAAPEPSTLAVTAGGTGGRAGVPAALEVKVAGKPVESIALLLPAGWMATPSSVALKQAASASFALTAPAEVPAGRIVIDAVASIGGRRVGAQAVVLTVAAPVEVAVQPVGAIDRTRQAISATIRNRRDRPLSGVARLRLHGAAQTMAEQPFGPLAPGAACTVTWQVPGLDLAAAAVTAEVAAVVEGVVVSGRQELTTREWRVLGPFTGDERDSALVAAIERGQIDLKGSYADAVGTIRTWTAARTAGDRPQQLDLAGPLKAPAGAKAYAVLWVKSPTRRSVRLLLQGKDCSIRAWIGDGALERAGADDTTAATLAAGWNRLLIATARTGNEWKVTTVFRDAAGDALRDLVYAGSPAQ